jgi:hypothetical protein
MEISNLSAANWGEYFTAVAGELFAYQDVTAFPSQD